ncbi:MAG TPA: helix-turn-helix transcriptional regulator [Anaerolineales bacterium]|nr:helix-turn-helix transcriptional regulator [Anaerolineales bacterium]
MRNLKLVNRLKVGRAERGLTQAELGRLAGVTRQTISSIENGEFVPSALLAFILAKCLEMPVEQLFRLEGDES